MSDSAFLELLARVGGVSREEMTDSTPVDPQQWDSIVLLDMIAAIDESFGVTVPTASLQECRTVGELRALVARSTAAH
jgi:acyl carrier protein